MAAEKKMFEINKKFPKLMTHIQTKDSDKAETEVGKKRGRVINFERINFQTVERIKFDQLTSKNLEKK